MKTKIFTAGDVGGGFCLLPSTKLLGSSPPITNFGTNVHFGPTIHFLPNSILGESGADFRRLSYGRQKVKFPDRVGFSRHIKTRL